LIPHLLGLIMVGAPIDASASDSSDATRAALQHLDDMTQAEDCKGVLTQLASPAFKVILSSLSNDVLLVVDQVGADCASREKRDDLLLPFTMQATSLANAPVDMWRRRLYVQWRQNDHAAMVETIERMADKRPDALNAIKTVSLAQISRELKNKGETDLRRRWLKVLAAPGYVPDEPGVSGAGFRFQYAVVAMEDGDKAIAVAAMARVDSPSLLIGASVDPRLRALIPADFDAKAAVEKDMARLRDVAAAHQNLLQPMLSIVRDERMLGADSEALATLDEVRPDAPGANYDDKAGEVNWWWDEVGRANTNLNHYEAAVDAMRHGMAEGEDGSVNVSQTINLAEVQCPSSKHLAQRAWRYN